MRKHKKKIQTSVHWAMMPLCSSPVSCTSQALPFSTLMTSRRGLIEIETCMHKNNGTKKRISFNTKNKSVSCMKSTCSKKKKQTSLHNQTIPTIHQKKRAVHSETYINVKNRKDEKNREYI